jgi:prolyl oligopeptidase
MRDSKRTVVPSVAISLVVLSVACSGPAHAPARQPSPQPLSYPVASRGNVVDDYFGTQVADPYRWLEDLDSPETRAWVAAEGQLTRAYLSGIPARSRIRDRLSQLNDYEKVDTPFREGNRYFYAYNSGLQRQSVLRMTSKSLAGEAVALDPNGLSSDGSLAVVGYVASPDGQRLAYGVSIAGSDWTEWRIRDLASGRDLPDTLRNTKYYPPQFSADGSTLYYSAFPPPAVGAELRTLDLGNALYAHVLGRPATSDRKLPLQAAPTDWQYEPHLSVDGRWLVAMAGVGEVGDKARENVYLLDLTVPESAPVAIAEGFDAAYVYVGIDGGMLYLLTTLDAPRGRVIAVDLQHPDRAHFRTALAQGSDAIDLTEPSVTLVDHRLIVRTIRDAHSRVSVYGLDGAFQHEVGLPGPGTAFGFDAHPSERETFYTYSDLITPRTVYRYDPETNQSAVFRAPKVAFEAASYVEERLFYPSKDGTRIPLLIAHKKGLALDGTHPVLLYGYGGFGIPILPRFAPERLAWLELGGIYAIANIRGGGEYGEAWHQQAIREHKQVGFDDFIAAGEYLIAQRYTSPQKLAIIGRSNGGLLMGAVLTQRPDLFAAVIAGVGVMDMLRFDQFGQGAGWEGDFGSPHEPSGFKALYAYSPVHHVKQGTRYPAVLVITGDHDTRVMPMHSFKFTAALQAAQAGPAPVLLDLESASGHGGGTTVTQAIEQNADIFAFLARNLAIDEPAVTSR